MRYLKTINETYDVKDIKELFVPFEDLGMSCELLSPVTVTEGEYSGRISRSIIIKHNLKLNSSSSYYEDKYWEFLDELLTLKSRLESDLVTVGNSWSNNFIRVTYLEEGSETGDILKLKTVRNAIYDRLSNSKTDFAYSTTMKLDTEKMNLTIDISSGYSNRAWRLFTKNIDLSNFNVDIQYEESPLKSTKSYRPSSDAKIIITVKES